MSVSKPLKTLLNPILKPLGKLIPNKPKIPGAPPPPASSPTFAQAGGSPSRTGSTTPSIGLSLITSGGAGSFTKLAKTKKRTLIGGA